MKPAPARKDNLMSFLNWKTLVPAAIVAAGLGFWSSSRGNAHATPAPDSDMVTVAVARVIRQDLAKNQNFEAEFRPYQEIDLHAKVAGFVKSINVDIGDRVKEGDLLATLEIPELVEDLEKATALLHRDEEEIKRAAAAHNEAHGVFTRISSVNQTKPNLIAQQDLDGAQAKDQTTEAALAAARQEVQVAQAEVKKLKAIADYCKITAPFSGVITKRFADEGALVQGGVTPSASAMPLVRLSQIDTLRLVFPVSVSYVAHVQLGDSVGVRIPGMDKNITGKICRFTRKVDTATRTMDAEVDLPNPDLSLIPGVYAAVDFKLDRREKVLTIPTEAISRQKSNTVFVLNPAGEIEERAVTLGLETPNRLEVVEGLQENDLVMLGSRSQVKPGQKVQPKLMEMGSLQ